MVNSAAGSKPSTDLPVLSEAEREHIVTRARVELFKLLPDISEADWPMLEWVIQVKINNDPELNRMFWTEPERAVVFALGGAAEWPEAWKEILKDEA